MLQTRSFSPLPNTSGLTPRYLRERIAAEAATRANPPAHTTTTTDLADLPRTSRTVDAATADLRRIVAAHATQHSVSRRAAPALASVAVMIGMLVNH